MQHISLPLLLKKEQPKAAVPSTVHYRTIWQLSYTGNFAGIILSKGKSPEYIMPGKIIINNSKRIFCNSNALYVISI